MRRFKVFQKAAATTKENHLWPGNTADDNKNMRRDAGFRAGDKYEMIVQPSKNAGDPCVKKAAQADSHQILAKGTVTREEDVKHDLINTLQEMK